MKVAIILPFKKEEYCNFLLFIMLFTWKWIFIPPKVNKIEINKPFKNIEKFILLIAIIPLVISNNINTIKFVNSFLYNRFIKLDKVIKIIV